MRKLIVILLAALLLASALAAVPASAAAATYDGTTKDTVNKILITEIGRNISAYTQIQHGMDFVEIYNNSTETVALDSLSLLLGVEIKSLPTDQANPYLWCKNEDWGRPLWKEWRDHNRFISEMEIKTGEILSESDANLLGISTSVRTQYLKNEDVSIEPGKAAVIWLITSQTVEWLRMAPEQIVNFDPKTEFLKNHYGNQVDPDDFTVVMVWAYSDYTLPLEDALILADDMFNFEYAPPTTYTMNANYILGVADKTWDVDTDASYDWEAGINEKLYSMSVLGTDINNYSNVRETSAIFAPANSKPFVQNAHEKFLNSYAAFENADYFAAGLARSYRENSAISFVCAAPTPGYVPEWHQLMIDSAKRQLSTNELAKIKTYIEETYRYVDACSGQHVFSNACDAYCNICCAEGSPAAHTYANNCAVNCTECGRARVPAAHTYTDGSDIDCNECGNVRAPVAPTDESSEISRQAALEESHAPQYASLTNEHIEAESILQQKGLPHGTAFIAIATGVLIAGGGTALALYTVFKKKKGV